MKVLIDINHPAHVHFFKNLRLLLISHGHDIIVTASKKDVAFKLLDEMEIPYNSVGSYGKSVLSKSFSIPKMAWRMYKLAKLKKPDVMIGDASSRITHAGYILKIPTCVFTDTEHAKLQTLLFRTFATMIVTPTAFQSNFGKKHVTYRSFPKLAYLHPEVFKRDKTVVENYGIDTDSTYFIVRFISWQAIHDVGQKGLSFEAKKRIIIELEKYGRVLLFTEDENDSDFIENRLEIKSSDMHHLLAYSKMYLGEGGSMATEASILGIPSILVNSLKAGVYDALENKYHLLYQIVDEEFILSKISEIMQTKDITKEFSEKRRFMLNENVNPNSIFLKCIENLIME